MDIPDIATETYNQGIWGIFGEFGSGEGAQIFYIQSGIGPRELDKFTLISDIPNSEKWSVRDLFQREVDDERVTKSILPYLQDDRKIKFFNPLTLTILPVGVESVDFTESIPALEPKSVNIDGREWTCYEFPNVFRVRFLGEGGNIGRIEWNDTKAKIVAIDGQHRLSALKRFKDDEEAQQKNLGFQDWTIPIVIFSVRALSEETSRNKRVLDVVRNIFVYINTEAKTPSLTRQILLSDESINNICTQELLEYSHSNDVKEEAVDTSRVPLLFYDWKGMEKGGKEVPTPGNLKSVQEMRDIIATYILGDDFGSKQQELLEITPEDSSLIRDFHDKKLSTDNSLKVRERFRQLVLPAVVNVVEGFFPYRDYIASLRNIEQKYSEDSDIARHALHKLRFGDHRSRGKVRDEIDHVYHDIVMEILHAQEIIPPVIKLDLSFRSVMSAFDQCRPYWFRDRDSGGEKLTDFSKWFVKYLNRAFADKWFHSGAKPSEFWRHVLFDHSDNVVNYKFDHIKEAGGAYYSAILLSYAYADNDLSENLYCEAWEDFSESLYGTIMKGYKREVRPELKEKYPNGGRELTEAVRGKAEDLTEKQLTKFDDYIEKNIIK